MLTLEHVWLLLKIFTLLLSLTVGSAVRCVLTTGIQVNEMLEGIQKHWQGLGGSLETDPGLGPVAAYGLCLNCSALLL